MSGLVSAKELRGKRATLAARMKEITAKPLGENGTLNAEQRQEFDRIDADVNAMKADIDRLERAETLESEMRESRGTIAGGRETPEKTDEAKKEAHKRAFDSYLRRGNAGVSPEERVVLEEFRAQGTNVDTAGGYLAPDEFRPVVERALLQFGGMRQSRATVLSTSNGNDLWMPVSDDTSNSGVIVGENNAHTTQDMSFGQKKLGSYLWSSKIIKVSRQLLQDSAVDVVGLVGQAFGERIGRAQNNKFTVGTGASEPYGIAATSTEGVAAASGQTASIIYNDFVDLEHSVDPAYRANAQWMLRDSSLKIIKKIKDGEGRPLWQPGLAVKSPDTILGYGYVINQDVAAMAASAKSLFFGDFSKYYIRDVQGMIVLRLDERYADNLQVGFLAFARADGNLLDAGTHPIKHYTNSAS